MPHSPASSVDSRILDIDTAPSSTSAPDTSWKPAGTTASKTQIEDEPFMSPALSGFTFNLDPEPTSPSSYLPNSDITPLPDLSLISFADTFSFADQKHPHALSRPLTKGIQGPNTMAEDSALSRSESASKRLNYFDSAFSNSSNAKEGARERIQHDSPIVAELRTNVIIKNEYAIVTSLSQHLSERFRRPESAILLTVTHSACLMMGGSFEPAYILDITAIPSEVQPNTNKRNAYLIQCFIADVMHVPSNRGVVRFLGLGEEHLAINGSTVAGEIERAERDAATVDCKEERTNGLVRSLTSKSSRKSMIGEKRKSMAAADNRKSIIRTAEKKESSSEKTENVFHTLERKFSTRSLRSAKSLKDKISPPIPIEFPSELLPSPTSISGFSTASSKNQIPNLPNLHRLSSPNGISGSSSKDSVPANLNKDLSLPSPLSSNPPPMPVPPFATPSERAGSEKDPIVTSSSRRPSVSARPQSARKNLSNITGPAEAIPSPPPIPPELDKPILSPRLSKRKSFVALFKKNDGIRT
ncbi:uncharacterized protein PV09_03959 [Verruconis gallopava]|uniref:L-dopachrome isomerase n=1 Tax=Verruconis gallopava TaxID=253628 RepID=A0A0D2ACX2_9PEZI|nr:uncharacterized protein PV09_03959 [Verruconis gallopava]KIW04768.1 hypothetical protein PV09_03959 [Verruconis gallopava]